MENRMSLVKSFAAFIKENMIRDIGDADNKKFAAWEKDMISKGAKKFKDTDKPHWGISAHDKDDKHLGSYSKSA
jgi:hypothetical protein